MSIEEKEHSVELSVQGRVLTTWDGVDVSLSMIHPGSPFSVSLWWSNAEQSTWQILQDVCKEGADCSVAIDNVTQIIGVLEAVEDSGGRDGGMFVVSGKSVAGVLMDADADPRILVNGLSLKDMFDTFLAPFGLTAQLLDGSESVQVRKRQNALHISTAVTHRRRRHRALDLHIRDGWRCKPGQRVWQMLDEACKRAGYLLWECPFPDKSGIGLVVDVPNESGDSAYALTRLKRADGTYEGNIIHAKHKVNGHGVPTEVTCFAGTVLSAQQDARLRSTLVNEVRRGDFSIRDPMPRPWFRHVDAAHNTASAQREAGRLVAMSTAHHRVYECDVRYYAPDHGTGDLFTINELAYVKDEFLGISEVMLVVGVNFHRSRKRGQVTTLTLLPKGNLRTLPELSKNEI